MDLLDFYTLIRSVPDFPQPGILFYDITPLLQHPVGLPAVIKQLGDPFVQEQVDYVVGIESRGFMFGTPLACSLGSGFIPVRKPGKLPPPVLNASYSLEYGSDQLEIRQDIFRPGDRVLIVDDVIATGGTARATAELVQQAGGEVCGFAFVIELTFLNGRKHLPEGIPVHSLLTYEVG
jgi:adenine phosphoribosyltransferase